MNNLNIVPIPDTLDKPELIRVRDIDLNVKRLYERGLDRGMSTGFPSLDEYYRPRLGEWTVWTGIPGHGKSTFLDNLMINTADAVGWKWAVFSAENLPVERHVATLAEVYAGKPFRKGPQERMSESELAIAASFLDLNFFFIQPDDDERTLSHILELAEEAVITEHVSGIVIDPWNELDHRRPSTLTETEYISQSLSKIRSFARTHNVHVFVVAHPAKLQKGPDGSYPVPTPYDIAGSAHWRNKSDCAITVWRDLLSNVDEVEVHVQKIRFREVGKIGMCRLAYDRVSGRFIDRGERGDLE